MTRLGQGALTSASVDIARAFACGRNDGEDCRHEPREARTEENIREADEVWRSRRRRLCLRSLGRSLLVRRSRQPDLFLRGASLLRDSGGRGRRCRDRRRNARGAGIRCQRHRCLRALCSTWRLRHLLHRRLRRILLNLSGRPPIHAATTHSGARARGRATMRSVERHPRSRGTMDFFLLSCRRPLWKGVCRTW